MNINTIVLLVGIIVWGTIQVLAMAFSTRYLDKMMSMMARFTDAVVKLYEQKIKGEA
jgi:hypothetical protein